MPCGPSNHARGRCTDQYAKKMMEIWDDEGNNTLSDLIPERILRTISEARLRELLHTSLEKEKSRYSQGKDKVPMRQLVFVLNIASCTTQDLHQ